MTPAGPIGPRGAPAKESHLTPPRPETDLPAHGRPPAQAARPPGRRGRLGFSEDFRRFFLRGLSALLPTLITIWLLIWVWSFLWENLGRHIITSIVWTWNKLIDHELMPFQPTVYTRWYWQEAMPGWLVQLIGVGLAILIIYMIGLLVGNLIGRTIWRLAEMAVMRVPLVRAIYPAVKQVTDFLLAERKAHFEGSRVVAVQRDARHVWSIGLVTGGGVRPLNESVGLDMVTVFIPSTPTSFSGYVVVVPREAVIELPLTVEEAMRLLISGGVITPTAVALPGAAGLGGAVSVAPAAAATPASAPASVPAPELLPGPLSGPAGAGPGRLAPAASPPGAGDAGQRVSLGAAANPGG